MMGSTLNLAYSGGGGGGAGVVTLDEFCSFKSSGTVDHGTATALSSARFWGSSAALKDICFLFGGSSQYHQTDSNSGAVDSYTSERVRGSVTGLSQARTYSSATANKNYALVFGGFYSYAPCNNVDAYNGSGVRTTATSLSTALRGAAAGTVGDYSLCIGGMTDSFSSILATVEAYNSDLVKTSVPSLSAARLAIIPASNGETLLAMGGATARASATTAVDVYTAALVHSTATAISQARATGAGTMAGDYFICAGGGYGCDDTGGPHGTTNVDFFDADLVHSVGTVLNEARKFLGGASVRAGAIICGGVGASYASDSGTNNAEMYSESMVHTTLESLNAARGTYLSVVSFPDADTVLVLGGGYYNFTVFSTVDYYAVPPAAFTELTVPAGSRYRFDGIHDAEQTAAATTKLSYMEAISGYIKLPSLTLGGVHENPTLVASI